MHQSVLDFANEVLDCRDHTILEVGSKNFNGSVKPIALAQKPKSYIGIDLQAGKDVDVLLDAINITRRYEKESFDTIICVEMLEHAPDWKSVITEIKKALKSEGFILLTTRSKGFKVHGYPEDYWRFEIEDMLKIFSDFKILKLQKDPQKDHPGVLLYAQKPKRWRSNSLKDINIEEIIL